MFRYSLLLLALTMSASAAVRIEKTNFHGWPNSYRLSNGEVELVVTGDVGPRVIRFAFVGGQNLFKEFTEQLGKTGETKWQARGGHRVWAAPEDPVLTYPADNFPVRIQTSGDSITATAPVEKMTGLEKTIVVKLAATGTGVDVLHRIKNSGSKPADLAVWALTMMAQGDRNSRISAPGQAPRHSFAHQSAGHVGFHQFFRQALAFHKKIRHVATGPQSHGRAEDRNVQPKYVGRVPAGIGPVHQARQCRSKTAVCRFRLLVRDLYKCRYPGTGNAGPADQASARSIAEHTEHWTLHRNIKVANWTDAELDKVVLPLVGRNRRLRSACASSL